MQRQYITKNSNNNSSTNTQKSILARTAITQIGTNTPLTQQEIENQQYQQDRFEATKLEIQAKYGTITSQGQERLNLLQAKKAEFWQRYLAPVRRSKDFANIPLTRVQAEAKSKKAIQAKLTIGAPGDKYEQEADRVAVQVVNQINAPVSQQSNQNLQREELPVIQTRPWLRLQAKNEGMAAPAELETSIQQARSGGQPLADNIRQPMEQTFGADFSGVKVHTDARADQLNQSIQAKAFTTGQDVFFRQGEYNPGSRGGQELIAHELTHVVQQGGRQFSQINSKIQRNLELDAVKATFNAQQRSHPGKELLIETIKDIINDFTNPESDLSQISVIREYMDVVLSTFTDGLVASGLPENEEIQKTVLTLKKQITEARLICEEIYRRCLISSNDEQASSLKAEAKNRLEQAWNPVYKERENVLSKLKATTKTGAREARTWRSEARDDLVTDDSIDMRSTKLAQVVKEDGFIPHIVVGLPTAGAHIAARVAGALNVFPADSSVTTELMTFRPRYVKKSTDTDQRTQEDIDKDNAKMLQSELLNKLLPLSSSLSMKPEARVLIVDDFSKSGGSLMQAAQKISKTLEILKYTPLVRTAVTRYTNAQLRDELTSDEGLLDNPIDYVVGVHGSGQRAAMREAMLDADGFAPREELMDQAENWEKGWTQSGLEAMHMMGITSPPPATSEIPCYITTACVQHKGLDDQCDELMVLRRFRDEYLLQLEKGLELVKLYYKYSPEIVSAIQSREDQKVIFEQLYEVIADCVKHIKDGDNVYAYHTYCKMVVELVGKFCPHISCNAISSYLAPVCVNPG